jgi:aspartate racemase
MRCAVKSHIGIVAVSPEGAALGYRAVFRHAALRLPPEEHPTVSVHNIPFARYLEAIRDDNWIGVSELLRESARNLAAIGAEVCFCPDNAVQHAVPSAEVGSPIPWLKMTDAVADAIVLDKRTTVGVIGTRYVTTGSAYQTDLGLKGIKLVRPSDEDAEYLDHIIFDELVFGIINEQSRASIHQIIDRFRDKGCEGVILGCSEGPLVVSAQSSSLPLYTPADLIAQRAIDYILDDD